MTDFCPVPPEGWMCSRDPSHDGPCAVYPSSRILVYRRRFWWSAINPDEALAMMDAHTTVRARSRERVIEKAHRRFFEQSTRGECEEVRFYES